MHTLTITPALTNGGEGKPGDHLVSTDVNLSTVKYHINISVT